MPPAFEFECPKGHITEELVDANVVEVVCDECLRDKSTPAIEKAHKILSATPTTFRFADLPRGKLTP